MVKVGSLMSCWTQDEVSQAFCRNALFAMSWCGRQILSCWTWWKRLSLIDSYYFSTAKLLERLQNPAPGMAQLAQVQRILRWLFADADSDFDSQLSHQELKAGFLLHEKSSKTKGLKNPLLHKAIFQRAPQPLGSSLGMEVGSLKWYAAYASTSVAEVIPSSEVDISTQQGEKNLPFSRQGVTHWLRTWAINHNLFWHVFIDLMVGLALLNLSFWFVSALSRLVCGEWVVS